MKVVSCHKGGLILVSRISDMSRVPRERDEKSWQRGGGRVRSALVQVASQLRAVSPPPGHAAWRILVGLKGCARAPAAVNVGQRCVERAVAEGPLAALDDRPRPGREPTITPEAKAWPTKQPFLAPRQTPIAPFSVWLLSCERSVLKLGVIPDKLVDHTSTSSPAPRACHRGKTACTPRWKERSNSPRPVVYQRKCQPEASGRSLAKAEATFDLPRRSIPLKLSVVIRGDLSWFSDSHICRACPQENGMRSHGSVAAGEFEDRAVPGSIALCAVSPLPGHAAWRILVRVLKGCARQHQPTDDHADRLVGGSAEV